MLEPHPLIHVGFTDDISTYIAGFLDDLEIARRSPKTIGWYRGHLERFAYWLRNEAQVTKMERITPKHLRQFIRYVQDEGERWDSDHASATRPASDHAVSAYYRSLRAWFNWLVEQEEIPSSPLAKVPHPAVKKDQPDPLSAQELESIVEVLSAQSHLRRRDDSLALRDRAMIATMLDTGVRCSELVSINLDQWDSVTGEIEIVSGKGNKSRRVRLGASGRRAVRRYWTHYRNKDTQDPASPLFLNVQGVRLTANGVGQMIRKVGEAAGIKRLHPHRFRHTCAVNAVRSGMNLFTLQVMLGHESLEMVRRYAKIADADVAAAMQDHSPLDRLDLRL